MLAAKHLERMGDYVTNICEYTTMLTTGVQADLKLKRTNHNGARAG